jgi:SpoVK/Ycf46/Vps4 family AAA+-type ATPase
MDHKFLKTKIKTTTKKHYKFKQQGGAKDPEISPEECNTLNTEPSIGLNLCDGIKESQILYNNAKFYYSAGQFQGALVSYACAAVSFNWIIKGLKNITGEKYASLIQKAENIQNCCLVSVEQLQNKLKSLNLTNPKDDEEEKEWEKRCTKIKPLIYSEGSKDCIFYNDVIGLHKEKQKINDAFIYPLMYPNLYPSVSKGILLYGPPGTGKTLIVKAAVNELQLKDPDIGVLYFAPSPADLKGKYVGETEKKIEEWFTCASQAACECQGDGDGAKKYIAIIFIDEIDSIAGSRDDDPTGLNANSVNTLLQMMDGINSKPNVSIIGATNYPWKLDSAVIRRFDTQILINIPSELELREILTYEVNKMVEMKDRVAKFCPPKVVKEDNDEIVKNKNCQKLQCKHNVKTQLFESQEPYNQFIIEYFEDLNNSSNTSSLSMVSGLINKLHEEQYTNSDISRLVKTASTYAGQLAVKANLFYNVKLFDTTYTKNDQYISSITKFRHTNVLLKKAVEILNKIQDGENIDKLIYQAEPPSIFSVEYGGYTYYHVKCLLYKNNTDFFIENPLVKNVFVKGNANKPMTDSDYKANILGGATGDINIIISFNFNFIEDNNANNTSKSLTTPGLVATFFKAFLGIFTGNQFFQKTSKEKAEGGGIKFQTGGDLQDKIAGIYNGIFKQQPSITNTNVKTYDLKNVNLTINGQLYKNPNNSMIEINSNNKYYYYEILTSDLNSDNKNKNPNVTKLFDTFNTFNSSQIESDTPAETTAAAPTAAATTKPTAAAPTAAATTKPTAEKKSDAKPAPLTLKNPKQFFDISNNKVIITEEYKNLIKYTENNVYFDTRTKIVGAYNQISQSNHSYYLFTYLQYWHNVNPTTEFHLINYSNYFLYFKTKFVFITSTDVQTIRKYSTYTNNGMVFYVNSYNVYFTNSVFKSLIDNFEIMYKVFQKPLKQQNDDQKLSDEAYTYCSHETFMILFGESKIGTNTTTNSPTFVNTISNSNSTINDFEAIFTQLILDDMFKFYQTYKGIYSITNELKNTTQDIGQNQDIDPDQILVNNLKNITDIMIGTINENNFETQLQSWRQDLSSLWSWFGRGGEPINKPEIDNIIKMNTTDKAFGFTINLFHAILKNGIDTDSLIKDINSRLIKDDQPKIVTLNIDDTFLQTYLASLKNEVLTYNEFIKDNKTELNTTEMIFKEFYEYIKFKLKMKDTNDTNDILLYECAFSVLFQYYKFLNIGELQQKGGEPKDGDKFVESLTNCAIETATDNKITNIKNKEVFIATSYNFNNIKKLQKESLLILTHDVISSMWTQISSFVKPTGYDKNTQAKITSQENLQNLINKNKLLATIFKTVTGVGFLIDSSIKEPPNKTIDDSEINKGNAKINWLMVDNNSWFTQNIKNIISWLVKLVIPVGGVGLLIDYFSSQLMENIIGQSVLGGYFYWGAMPFLFILNILWGIQTYWTKDNLSIDEIVNNVVKIEIFKMITESPGIKTTNFTDEPSKIFQTNLNIILQKSVGMLGKFLNLIPGYKSLNNNVTYDASLNTDIKFYNEQETDNKKIKTQLYNLSIPLSCFYKAKFDVRSTYAKELGRDLIEYNNDKNALLEKKKKEKK